MNTFFLKLNSKFFITVLFVLSFVSISLLFTNLVPINSSLQVPSPIVKDYEVVDMIAGALAAKNSRNYFHRISKNISLPVDQVVTEQFVVIISYDVINDTNKTKKVFLQSDGRYFSKIATSVGSMRLVFDGKQVGNSSTIDWGSSSYPQQHSFNVIGIVSIPPGRHNIQLQAINMKPGGSFVVGAGTNLNILESTSRKMQMNILSNRFGPVSTQAFLSNEDYSQQASIIPIHTFLGFNQVPLGHSAFLFSASLSHVDNGGTGDAMAGITLDGACPQYDQQSWTVNDIYHGAEMQSPIYSHALNLGHATVKTPQAFASVFPWIAQRVPDPVEFTIDPGATLVSIEDPNILGSAVANTYVSSPCTTTISVCLGNGTGCPSLGSKVVIAESIINIPSISDGIVMVMAKARGQPTSQDAVGGTLLLGISVDGLDVGSLGVQDISSFASDSQRTLTASHLFDYQHRLSAGQHKVQIWMKAIGFQKRVSTFLDLPLLFFD